MKKLLITLVIAAFLIPGCTCRHRVGPQGSTGDGGIAPPDSTTRYDTNTSKHSIDSNRSKTIGR